MQLFLSHAAHDCAAGKKPGCRESSDRRIVKLFETSRANYDPTDSKSNDQFTLLPGSLSQDCETNVKKTKSQLFVSGGVFSLDILFHRRRDPFGKR